MDNEVLIKIVENLLNGIEGTFDYKIYDVLKMDNTELDTKKINGIAEVTNGIFEPVKGLSSSSVEMSIDFVFPVERLEEVKRVFTEASKQSVGLIINNSEIATGYTGSTEVLITYPTQGVYNEDTMGENITAQLVVYFDINENSVFSNEVTIEIQKGFQYNAVEVDEESEGDFYVMRNIQTDDVTNLVCKAEPIHPTITEYDTIGIDFVYDGNNLVADYGFVGNQKCFRVGYPETEEYYGKDFYSWNSGVLNNVAFGEGWNKYKQYKFDLFSDLISNPFGISGIISMVEKEDKIYCGGLDGKFAIYNISTDTFGDLISTPFGIYGISSILEKYNKIYCGGSNGAFAIYDISTGTFGNLITTPFGFSAIYSMVEKEDKIYCGGDGGKFAIYDISTGTFGDLISTPFGTSDIRSIIEKDNKIYCGGSNGAFAIYDISTGTFGSLISTPFISSIIYSILEKEDKIYCGGGSGAFATYGEQLIIEITTPPTYTNVYILSSNIWQVMSDLIEYSGADRYLELQLPQDYVDNRYEEFYEKEVLWENIPYHKQVITRTINDSTNNFANNTEKKVVNVGQALNISLVVSSQKGSIINKIKKDKLLGLNIKKSYNLKLTDEDGEFTFNNMVVSGNFTYNLEPRSVAFFQITFVYGKV